MSDRKLIPGKFVWFEHVSSDPRGAQAFHGEVLGWKSAPFVLGGTSYDMIYLGDTMIGGYDKAAASEPPRWRSCASVENVDDAVKAAVSLGGKVLDAPADLPGVGRLARITDAQGAELMLITSEDGDPPDVAQVPVGGFVWNELHTTDPVKALVFYEKVLGFTSKAMDMGPDAGTYYIVSRGGVERGGVTHWLAPGDRPHWLPYVHVDDADATATRARNHGATLPMNPEDIPGVGRFGVLKDPTGTELAFIKPAPMPKAG